jgi:hypothetical protein
MNKHGYIYDSTTGDLGLRSKDTCYSCLIYVFKSSWRKHNNGDRTVITDSSSH